jgi:hypothetical protein
MPFTLDPGLREYCTPRQLEVLTALEAHGSERKAAEALGVNNALISQVKRAVLKKAASFGYAPDFDMVHPTPPGFHVKGASTLYDMQTGEARLQWLKTHADANAQEEMMREAVEAMSASIPRAKPIQPPKRANEDLLNLYVLTDFHWGMLSWHKEGGADWDLKIAEETLRRTFEQMMAQSPDSEVGIIGQLGDMIHTDYPGFRSQTPLSGHDLDVDGRPHKVIGGVIRILRNVIDMALTKHPKVVVLMAEGNHDGMGSVWLQHCFAALYADDPRVEVIVTPLPYYVYEHGETMLAFHHGHLRKPTTLTGIFAAQFPQAWGRAKYRYGHCGHLHHRVKIDEREDAGMTVTQHRSLTAKDAYSARGAYYAERKTECITYHRKHGQVASVHVTPEMVE